jgi:cytoskeletal protein CcmA (bactofilin family)
MLSVLLYGLLWAKTSELEYIKKSQLAQHLESAKVLIGQEDFYQNNIDGQYNQLINDDSLTIELKPWGAYCIASCRAFNGSISTTRDFLFGNRVNRDTTLELIDNRNPLVLVGSSRLKGEVKLPQAGIKYGTIKNNYYTGERLNSADITYSRTELGIDLGKSPYWSMSEEYSETFDLENNTNSFSNNLNFITLPKGQNISTTIKGYTVIRSETSIIVDKQAQLYNVILEAPFVKINSGFRGKVQIIADSIVIESNCTLVFPSSLICKSARQGHITIKENSTVGGSIVALGTNDKKLPIVKMEQGTQIYGEVLCNGYLDLSGEIYGKVITNAFLHRERGGTYINYLVDTKILPLNIQESHFPGSINSSTNRLQYIETLP